MEPYDDEILEKIINYCERIQLYLENSKIDYEMFCKDTMIVTRRINFPIYSPLETN